MTITLERPLVATVASLLPAAAVLIGMAGHHQGDYCPAGRRCPMPVPHAGPLSIVAALRCAETGDPHGEGPLSTAAVRFLAGRLLVDGGLPCRADDLTLQFHVAEWGDVAGRTVADVVEVLLSAAAEVEMAVAS